VTFVCSGAIIRLLAPSGAWAVPFHRKGPAMMRLMTTRALGISVMSFAVASGIAVTSAPDAAANTYCGKSSHGASVSAGPNTSCAYALNAANTPLGTGSMVTNSKTGQTQTIAGASRSNPYKDIDDLCDGAGALVTNPRQTPGMTGVVCEDGTRYYIRTR